MRKRIVSSLLLVGLLGALGAQAYGVTQQSRQNIKHFTTFFSVAGKNASSQNDMKAAIAEKNGLTKDNINWIVPHQANVRIIEAVAHRMEVPMDKVLVNIEHYGNTSAATLPLCIWDYEDKLKKGDNIIFTAFGAGFTWGAVYVKWGYDGKKES